MGAGVLWAVGGWLGLGLGAGLVGMLGQGQLGWAGLAGAGVLRLEPDFLETDLNLGLRLQPGFGWVGLDIDGLGTQRQQ